MSTCKDETGNRYGRLTVIKRNGHLGNSRKVAAWLCRCDCGKELTVGGGNLRCGQSKSCGCLKLEVIKQPRKSEAEKKANYKARREREKAAKKQAQYGITPHEFNTKLKIQNGICLLPSCNRKASAIDHCHQCGDFRGLLCPQCNSMLGFAYDNPSLLREAANYLEAHKHGQQQ